MSEILEDNSTADIKNQANNTTKSTIIFSEKLEEKTNQSKHRQAETQQNFHISIKICSSSEFI